MWESVRMFQTVNAENIIPISSISQQPGLDMAMKMKRRGMKTSIISTVPYPTHSCVAFQNISAYLSTRQGQYPVPATGPKCTLTTAFLFGMQLCLWHQEVTPRLLLIGQFACVCVCVCVLAKVSAFSSFISPQSVPEINTRQAPCPAFLLACLQGANSLRQHYLWMHFNPEPMSFFLFFFFLYLLIMWVDCETPASKMENYVFISTNFMLVALEPVLWSMQCAAAEKQPLIFPSRKKNV